MADNTGNAPSNKPAMGRVRAFYTKHPIISTLAMILVASLLLLWFAFIFLDLWTDHGSTTKVPDVRTLSYDEAERVLANSDLRIEIADSIYDASYAPGTVMESWPRAGAIVKPGREVYVTITSFQPKKVTITMPITGISSRQAMSQLESWGIEHVRLVSVPSQFPDLVLGAKYEGRDITPGMHLPVTAVVTLEVGTVPTVTEIDTSADDFGQQSTTVEDDESVYPFPVTPDEQSTQPQSSEFYD